MNVQYRKPETKDGVAIHDLVAMSPPLDPNSAYCNLLQASYFSDTSIVAELDGELFGFITGFAAPKKPDTLFVWQVAVSPAARGIGLASNMLKTLADRAAHEGIRFIETTITDDNKASWKLFERFAEKQGIPLEHAPFYKQIEHFQGRHATEHLLRIGPFSHHADEATHESMDALTATE